MAGIKLKKISFHLSWLLIWGSWQHSTVLHSFQGILLLHFAQDYRCKYQIITKKLFQFFQLFLISVPQSFYNTRFNVFTKYAFAYLFWYVINIKERFFNCFKIFQDFSTFSKFFNCFKMFQDFSTFSKFFNCS